MELTIIFTVTFQINILISFSYHLKDMNYSSFAFNIDSIQNLCIPNNFEFLYRVLFYIRLTSAEYIFITLCPRAHHIEIRGKPK